MTPQERDEAQLDAAVDDWLTELQLATTFDPNAGTMAGRPLEEYQLVADIADAGPRNHDEARRVLDRPDLRELLRQSWADDPPPTSLVELLAADEVASELLDLVDSPMVVRGPAAWFRAPAALALESPAAHAAASKRDTLLDVHRDEDLGVVIEGWRTRRGLEARVTAGSRPVEAMVALRLQGRSERVLLVPLSLAAMTTTVTLVDVTGLDVEGIGPADRAWVLNDGDATPLIEASVRLSDGRTQRLWQEIAGRADVGPHVRAAVAAGLW